MWARALLLFDKGAYQAYRLHEVVRDEILFGFLPPEVRPAITDAAYADLATYLPGGARFESGLFAWEEQALAAPPFPPRGRVLLGASGGGRELSVLAARGYDVVAFEPNARLFEGSLAVARGNPRVEVHRAAYEDLERAAERGDGPLGALRGGPSIDAVILGWGSITHLLDAREHARLLSALARLAPGAPVLVSFYTRPAPAPGSRTARARALVRAALRLAGSTATHGDELCYASAGGFGYCFSEDELRSLARGAGYEVTAFESEPFGHAVLVPARLGTRVAASAGT